MSSPAPDNEPQNNYINSAHGIGTSSGAYDPNWKGEEEDILCFTLGMNFLSQKIPETSYTEAVQKFCQQLIFLFNGEGMPYLGEDRSLGDKMVTFSYDAPLTRNSKSRINKMVMNCLLTEPSFANQREYYILSDGIQNSQKGYALLDKRGKENIMQFFQVPRAISLASFVAAKSLVQQKREEAIPDDLTLLSQKARIEAEDNSLRHSFGKSTFDQYIAKLHYFSSDLREQYNIELTRNKARPWRLAMLSSLIAYETTDRNEFYRMIARKVGHLRQISESIRNNYSDYVQKDILLSEEDIYDQTWYTFNHRLIEGLQQYYYIGDNIWQPNKVKSRAVRKYKNTFFNALQDVQRFDLQPTRIDTLIEKEEDIKDWFNVTFKTGAELMDRMIIELSKYNGDYTLSLQTDELVKQDIFNYTDKQLEDYIDNSPDGLTRCCAVWLYIFNAGTLMNFGDRLDKYISVLVEHRDFTNTVEDGLDEIYRSLSFNGTYAHIEIKSIFAVLQHRRDAIEYLIANAEDYSQSIESFKPEHEFYIQTMKLLSMPKVGDGELDYLMEMYVDIIDGYTPQPSDDNDDELEGEWD